jgi:hypothetical protein
MIIISILFFILVFILLLLIFVLFFKNKEKYDCVPFEQCKSSCISDDKWEGWASTTKFYDNEKCWPQNVKNAENLNCINKSENRWMGAAIPWRVICKMYGSRQNLLDTLGPILYEGKQDTQKNCFEIQPISVSPNQLKQGSFDRKAFGQKFDINDKDIIALDDKGNEYPTYIIFPYEGCGGDCKTSDCRDCFNNCYVSVSKEDPSNLNNLLKCDLSTINTSCCQGMKILSKNNWDKNNAKEFVEKASYPLAINDDGNYEKADPLNWCSGLNHHFDIAMDTPLWTSIKPDDTRGPFRQNKGDLNNIIVRYRRINCPKISDCKPCV